MSRVPWTGVSSWFPNENYTVWAIVGLAVLIVIAWTIGRLDARARDGAWRRIASNVITCGSRSRP